MGIKAVSFVSLFIFGSLVLWAQDPVKPQRVHYFYNSGWLVETSHHLLVFDFIPNKEAGISFADLPKQWQENPQNKPVVVFISHDHPDHFTDSIFALLEGAKTMRVILGWQPKQRPAAQHLILLSPGDSLLERGLSVYTHPATDDGSAFLVTVDGLTVYHAGDHALWVEEIANDYTMALERIRTKTSRVDLAFLPAARGMMTGCKTDTVMEKSVRLAIQTLQPRTVALQHIGCADSLHQYEQVRQHLSDLKVDWIIPVSFNSRSY